MNEDIFREKFGVGRIIAAGWRQYFPVTCMSTVFFLNMDYLKHAPAPPPVIEGTATAPAA